MTPKAPFAEQWERACRDQRAEPAAALAALEALLSRAEVLRFHPFGAEAPRAVALSVDACGELRVERRWRIVAGEVTGAAEMEIGAAVRRFGPEVAPGDEVLDAVEDWGDLLRIARREAPHCTGPDAPSRAAHQLLVQLGDERVAHLEVRPGSIGWALQRGALAGLEAALGGDSLRLDYTALEGLRRAYARERRAWVALRLTARVGGKETVLLAHEDLALEHASLALPAHPDAAERLREVLCAALEQARAHPRELGGHALLGPALDALVPAFPEAGLGRWLERAAPAALGVVRSEAAGCRAELEVRRIAVGRGFHDFGQVRHLLRAAGARESGATCEREQEVYSGQLAPEVVALPAPEPGDAHAEGALACYRAALGSRLTRLAPALAAGEALPHDLVPEVVLEHLLVTWLRHGPPGPRPERLRVSEEAVASAAASLRALTGGELAGLRRVDARAAAGWRLGAWTVLLCPALDGPDALEEDRLYLWREGGEPRVVLMGDPLDSQVQLTVDGDAVAFRGFAAFLRAAVLRAGADLVWQVRAGDGERTAEVRASEHLRFRDGLRERWGDALVDWRCQAEAVEGGLPFWRSHLFGLGEAERRRFAEGVADYHRFLRELIDPDFVGQAPPAP